MRKAVLQDGFHKTDPPPKDNEKIWHYNWNAAGVGGRKIDTAKHTIDPNGIGPDARHDCVNFPTLPFADSNL